jgi:hypothetical protein
MADRIVVLRAHDAVSFVADGCAALADAVNEVRLQRRGDEELIRAYAAMVVAYSRVQRDELSVRGETARLAVIDHLVERLGQAGAGEINISVLDIVDRLHGELTREPAVW